MRFTVHDLDDTLALAREQKLIEPPPSVELEPGDFIMRDADEAQAPCDWHYFTRSELGEARRVLPVREPSRPTVAARIAP